MTLSEQRQAIHVPTNYQLFLTQEDLGIEVYKSPHECTFMGFGGRRGKPDFYIRFSSLERADKHLTTWIDGLRKHQERKIQAREALKSTPNPLKLGDVLHSIWGYEQTNVDYYEVTNVIGKRTVEIRPIDRLSDVTGRDQGDCVPAPGQYTGPAERRRVDAHGSVRVGSHGYASKVKYTEIDGVRVYKPDSWTSYY